MQSPARFRLQMKFSELALGQQFHLVNTVMLGAVPGSPLFERIADERENDYLVYNARRTDIDLKVRVRESADVELV